MVSLRRILPVVVVVVVFTMLLICRGLGLHNMMVPYDTRIIFITEMLLAIVAMIVFFALRKHYISESISAYSQQSRVYLSNIASFQSLSTLLTQYSKVLAVYIFGAGSIALNISYIYYKSQCMSFYVPKNEDDAFKYTDQKVRQLTSVVKLLMVMLQIPLLHLMTTFTFSTKRHIAATASLLILIGANTALWIFNFLNESKAFGIFEHQYPKEADTTDLYQSCFNHSSIAEVYSHTTMDDLFFPFYMQFIIISIEILYGVYFIENIRHPIVVQIPNAQDYFQGCIQAVQDFTNTQNVCLVPTGFRRVEDTDNTDENSGDDEEEDEHTPLLDSERPTLQRRIQRQKVLANVNEDPNVRIDIIYPALSSSPPQQTLPVKAWFAFLSIWNPLTALIIGILQASLMKFFLLQKDYVDRGYISTNYMYSYVAVPLVCVSIILDGLPMLLITIYCCVIMARFKITIPRPKPMRIVLFLALIGISILCCYKMIICAITLGRAGGLTSYQSTLTTLSLLETLIFWPQYYLQVILIYLGNKRKPDSTLKLFDSLSGLFSYLAMGNFMHWLIGSFLETDYLRSRLELQSSDGWDTLVYLFSPFFIYFFFVSTILLLEIKARLMEKAPNRWQLGLTMTNLRPHLR